MIRQHEADDSIEYAASELIALNRLACRAEIRQRERERGRGQFLDKFLVSSE